MEGKVVSVKRLPSNKQKEESNRELYAAVAFHYPQYTLKDVARLPHRDVKLLLRTAERINTDKYMTLTQIAVAPHTEKGKGIKSLMDHFKKKLDN